MTYTQLFLFILVIHTLADFSLQTELQAKNKSEGKFFKNKYLLGHVSTYTLTWMIAIFTLPLTSNIVVALLAVVIGIGLPHLFIDAITSKISSKLFKQGDTHNGFLVVGYDQMFHLICLWIVLTYIVNVI